MSILIPRDALERPRRLRLDLSEYLQAAGTSKERAYRRWYVAERVREELRRHRSCYPAPRPLRLGGAS